MNSISDRCLLAASTLQRVAHGCDMRPFATRAQVEERAAEMLREASCELRLMDPQRQGLLQEIRNLQRALAEARMPWWVKAKRSFTSIWQDFLQDFGPECGA